MHRLIFFQLGYKMAHDLHDTCSNLKPAMLPKVNTGCKHKRCNKSRVQPPPPPHCNEKNDSKARQGMPREKNIFSFVYYHFSMTRSPFHFSVPVNCRHMNPSGMPWSEILQLPGLKQVTFALQALHFYAFNQSYAMPTGTHILLPGTLILLCPWEKQWLWVV